VLVIGTAILLLDTFERLLNVHAAPNPGGLAASGALCSMAHDGLESVLKAVVLIEVN